MNPFDGEKGYAEKLPFGQQPVLLVIDMIKAYTETDSPFYSERYTPVLENIIALIELCRSQGIMVVYSNLNYDRQHLSGGHFVRKVKGLQELYAKPKWREFSEGINPTADELVLAKQYASCFWGTPLSSILAYGRHDSLFICGVSTSGCVRATATDAIQYGYIPMLVYDAVGDRHEEIHRQNLYDLQMKYADLYALDELKEKYHSLERLKKA